ncbi:helix-turn-helix domain-containing protein [Chryseobacterium sp.]|jgi:DNA-binding HxlR family transcriptional regulator|uniref:winged helix-turn-helix transcriptional regulator n=1 Tax=Chryseobacterium sp. TaxID=1871047 RepID=UPI0028466F9A|nr:helix-turn-helix domain-containing protein [Chryseobacterium sp.]MDR3023050.1 helix-turn-helix transcriptional regulator [Chryseobacterium sp.]
MSVKKIKSSCLETIKPVRDALDVLNGKWKLAIIVSVSVGNDRFTDIQDSIPGITPKVLAKELKELEQHQLIKRTIIDDYPVKIIYQPQPYSSTLNPIIFALKDWGTNHKRKLFEEGFIMDDVGEIPQCLPEEK